MAKDICDASVNGLRIGSTEVEFNPDQIKSGEFTADTKTAGYSIWAFSVNFVHVKMFSTHFYGSFFFCLFTY